MYYLREFKTGGDYEAYASSGEFLTPNVSYIEETNEPKYTPLSIAPPVSPVAPVGASIYGLDAKFYSVDGWTAAGKSNSDAVGVAVSDGEHRFVIHPTAEVCDERFNDLWINDKCIEGSGPATFYTRYPEMTSYLSSMSYENYYEASKDFNGHRHTLAYESAAQDAVSNYESIALPGYINYCQRIMFGHGAPGYLMSAGEVTLIYKHITEVNECLNAIGGIPMDMEENMYMTSSVTYIAGTYPSYSWVWVGGISHHVNQTTYFDATNIYVRAIAQC